MGTQASEIDLQGFYPAYLEIESVERKQGEEIHIRMKSSIKAAICPSCGEESTRKHSKRWRKGISDISLLGHGVVLDIQTHKFFCDNNTCGTIVFTESMADFLDNRWRWTRRCEDFIIAVAMNTSCEAASKICKLIKIRVSGDTVIRMLLRHVSNADYIGESIGIDDWAMRKGHHYGTMICDLETRRPLALLPGRDGESLKKWLARNKQIKLVTRDRSGEYAAAVSEVLPTAVQVADRFHLHKNLLEAVHNALKGIVPEKIWFVDEEGDFETLEEKKL